MYNYEFDSTFYYLNIAEIEDSDNPLLPFLDATTSWLSIQSNNGIELSYSDIRQSIKHNIPIYEKLIIKYPKNPEYLLYLGSLYGLEARIELAYSHWFRAFISTRKGNKYIKIAHDMDENLKDVYLPLGLISYYTCISSPVIQFAAKISGIDFDCNKSIDYLELASNESYYSYIESSNILSYIYLYMEHDYELALKKIEPLVSRFPNHPFFPFIEAECLIRLGKLDEYTIKRSNLKRFLNNESYVVRTECLSKMNYLNALKSYYSNDFNESIRYNTLVINDYTMEFNWLLALSYYNRALSYIEIAKIYDAKKDLNKVISIDFKFPEKQQAQKLLSQLSNVK